MRVVGRISSNLVRKRQDASKSSSDTTQVALYRPGALLKSASRIGTDPFYFTLREMKRNMLCLPAEILLGDGALLKIACILSPR